MAKCNKRNTPQSIYLMVLAIILLGCTAAIEIIMVYRSQTGAEMLLRGTMRYWSYSAPIIVVAVYLILLRTSVCSGLWKPIRTATGCMTLYAVLFLHLVWILVLTGG